MFVTQILDEYRTPKVVAILERQQPNGDDWGGYTVKSVRKYFDEDSARKAYELAKKNHRPRKAGAKK